MKVGYSNIDAHTPHLFVNALDGMNQQLPIQEYKRRVLTLLEISAGQSVLDVGCGMSGNTAKLADAVGAAGRAVGIDRSSAMIAEARRRFSGACASLNFEVCAAEQLPFNDATFDRAVIDRTLQHVDDPSMVLREVHRVLRPGGRIVAIEPDWQTVIFNISDFDMSVRFASFLAGTFVNTGRAGRSLPRLAREAGFAEAHLIAFNMLFRNYSDAETTFAITPALDSMIATGAATEAEASDFRQSLLQGDSSGKFVACLTIFIYVGTKSTSNAAGAYSNVLPISPPRALPPR